MLLPMRLIFQEMAAEKVRLSLLILAVAWATLCIATMLAVGEGLRQGVIRSSESGNGKLIYLTGGYATINSSNFYIGKALQLTSEDLKVIKALPSVKHAQLSAIWDEQANYKDHSTWQEPLAVYPGYQALTGLKIVPGGRWFNPLDIKEQRKVIILGESAAISLFNESNNFDWMNPPKLKVDPVGRKIKLGSEEFIVIGLIKRSSANIERGIPLNESLFIPFTTWKRFHQNSAISAINIELMANADRKQVAKTVKQVIARKYGASIEDDKLLQVEDMLLKQKTIRQFLIGLQGFLGIIGLVTVGVAGIGIANVMYATVKRSTKDIGVRMAIGATPITIRLHYLTQSLFTMSVGGGMGLGLTYFLMLLIQAFPLAGNDLYDELGQPTPELSLPIVGLIILALGLVGILAAWFPANRAALITPLEALQSE
ncbi:ABC transporter permease [Aliivibrio fischeri]|uniref:ABC transporter permease n=1 Tax=Aliivibrio fischeri TaxID=668 RepID=UPI0007C4FD91|nr:ABC transporter permease [Aliivibrio fischeri]MCE7534709.1 ABC transporter permease [Aliivibrio fischeri]MCE7557455.1 ABC transporter permease [Aliivibrio fischeri]MCE7576318.1 ABC transporter permease [Aliivibrio fischeri]MCE7588608.1 ABC transporter permease [Aliivibrio fischeri]